MPRNVLDLIITKKLGEHIEITAGIKDILASKAKYAQFPKFIDKDGITHEREQVTKEFKTGQSISLTARYSF